MKTTGSKQVLEYLERLEHPLKNEILEVRTIVLGADERLTEQIKWNAPSFCIDGHDRITFNLHGKGMFRLVFHCGAKPKAQPEKRRIMEDAAGLLEWMTNDRAVVPFKSANDVEVKRERLAKVVPQWLNATRS